MVKTDNSHKIKDRKNNVRAAKGFKDGKLYRGSKDSKKTTKNYTRKDYKNTQTSLRTGAKTVSNSNAKKKKNPKTEKFKKMLVGVVLVAIPLILTAIIINKMTSVLAEEEDSTSEINNIRNEHLNDFDDGDLTDIDVLESTKDGEGSILADSDEDIDIPDFILDDSLETEPDNNDINEGTTGVNDIDIEEDSRTVVEDDNSNNINTDNNIEIPKYNTEAIFFLSKQDGKFGLVGFPLSNRIKNMNLKEKIVLLSKELMKTPEGESTTMLPDGTKLLGFRLVQNVLYLNYNDNFNYNVFGMEGDIQQIAQIVYTFTSLDGVDKVTFMINGEVPEYIGSHGLENKEWTEVDIGKML